MIDHVVGGALLGLVAIAVPVAGGMHSRSAGRSDFSAAARPVSALCSAACVSGEMFSAVAFLGAAVVVLVHGAGAIWVASGLCIGFCLLTTLVAAPLRRSGVYSPSDFAEWRLGSRKVRRIVSACVVFAGWLYLVAQYLAAGLLVDRLAGLPAWLGWAVLFGVTLVIVLGGGGATGFQAAQFWIKLLALAVPAAVLAAVWLLGAPERAPDLSAAPLTAHQPPGDGIAGVGPPRLDTPAGVLSLHVALALGIVGIPQFIGRLSAARGAREARRTVLAVAGLLGAAMPAPLVLGWLARDRASDVVAAGQADAALLILPQRLLPGPYGDVLTVLIGLGAAVAVLSVSAALCRALGGTITQCMLGGGAGMFRLGVVLAMGIPVLVLALVPGVAQWSVLTPVVPALALTAVTVAPMLLLGLWWRGLTAPGVAVGLITGLAGMAVCLAAEADLLRLPGPLADLPAAPVPPMLLLVTAAMVLVSLATPRSRPGAVEAMLDRMHVARPAAAARTRPAD
ncbi:Na+(H+)/acetate symporter ActP [Murinocardiopsis flavida]|uniref:Na+(H+)/acetate symporter ActP n=1 Tax=Murinocardiopsis flavida TaxID=645275 RepID=A0A2P8DI44_9ACTN|nr:cation acetate symporter [Murinocardiopsis flavida]PSK96892.1 Na+(H+)/acetate symporter ActP [Murinocardiopsis flavida]